MPTSAESLVCPITLEIFRNPVLAQDGYTYERDAIENWIKVHGTSPKTGQQLSLDHLYPNHIVKELVGTFEKSLDEKNYQFVLNVDVRKKKGRPLFQTTGKAIYYAEWLPTNSNKPDIIILKIDGARALREASLYVNLSRHPHVLRTFGFAVDKTNHGDDDGEDESNSTMLVQEYASEGSLLELLQDRSRKLDEKILTEIFLQIIEAMIFLAYNRIVHGDLACRNVLIFRFDADNPKNIIAKVTDFGLSRQSTLYSKTVASARNTTLDIIPTRYAAPEVLSEGLKSSSYTEKSDVYSMGVLMWEAYSRGNLPWSKIETDTEVIQNVMNNIWLPQPSKCSSKYWNVITKTWYQSPDDRPTFKQLKNLLTEQIYLPGILSFHFHLY